jgi:hypothetical protein
LRTTCPLCCSNARQRAFFALITHILMWTTPPLLEARDGGTFGLQSGRLLLSLHQIPLSLQYAGWTT